MDYLWSCISRVLSSHRLLGAYADVGFFSDKQGYSDQEKFKHFWQLSEMVLQSLIHSVPSFWEIGMYCKKDGLGKTIFFLRERHNIDIPSLKFVIKVTFLSLLLIYCDDFKFNIVMCNGFKHSHKDSNLVLWISRATTLWIILHNRIIFYHRLTSRLFIYQLISVWVIFWL